MSNIFAEMQQMSLGESTVTQSRKTLNDLVTYMKGLSFQEEQISFFANLRQLKATTFHAVDGFMVTEDLAVNHILEEFRHDSLGFVEGSRLIYSGRFVLPVKDVKGDVAGFVGYDKFEQPKYLDSKNHGYKAKHTTMYGMENLPQYYKDGYCIFVEGPMCKLWLQQNGFNAMSWLGSYLSPYVMEIMKRFGRNCICIPDGDDAGEKAKKQIKSNIPQAQVLRMTKAKDVDDSTLEEKEIDGEKVKIRRPDWEEQLVFELQQRIRSPFVRTEMIA